MTKEMIPDLISQGEGVTIEFKECRTKSHRRYIPLYALFLIVSVVYSYGRFR